MNSDRSRTSGRQRAKAISDNSLSGIVRSNSTCTEVSQTFSRRIVRNGLSLHKLLSSKVLGIHSYTYTRTLTVGETLGVNRTFCTAEFLFQKNTTTPKAGSSLTASVYINMYIFLYSISSVSKQSTTSCFIPQTESHWPLFLFCFLVPDDENTHFSNVFFFFFK